MARLRRVPWVPIKLGILGRPAATSEAPAGASGPDTRWARTLLLARWGKTWDHKRLAAGEKLLRSLRRSCQLGNLDSMAGTATIRAAAVFHRPRTQSFVCNPFFELPPRSPLPPTMSSCLYAARSPPADDCLKLSLRHARFGSVVPC